MPKDHQSTQNPFYSNTGPVILPKGTIGLRSWRRERLRRQRRNRRIAALGIIIIVILGAILIGMVQPAGEKIPGHHRKISIPSVRGPLPSILSIVDQQNNVQSIMVLAPYQNSVGGSVLIIPPNLLTQVVPGGPQAISNALVSTPKAPGSEKLIATVENLLGVEVGSSITIDYLDLESLLQGAGTLRINLPYQISPSQGSSGASFGPGEVSIAPSQIGDFISDVSSVGETEQMTRIGEFINQWISTFKATPIRGAVSSTSQPVATSTPPSSTSTSTPPSSRTTSTSTPPGSRTTSTSTPPSSASTLPSVDSIAWASQLFSYLRMLSRGLPAIEVLPVSEIAAVAPGAPNEFQINQSRYESLVSMIFPAQANQYIVRPKVQLLNGTGALGVDEQAISRIVPLTKVVLSGNACSALTNGQQPCFGYKTTQIITYDSLGRDFAKKVQRMLGFGTILRSSDRGGIVDMTVIIGADFHVNG